MPKMHKTSNLSVMVHKSQPICTWLVLLLFSFHSIILNVQLIHEFCFASLDSSIPFNIGPLWLFLLLWDRDTRYLQSAFVTYLYTYICLYIMIWIHLAKFSPTVWLKEGWLQISLRWVLSEFFFRWSPRTFTELWVVPGAIYVSVWSEKEAMTFNSTTPSKSQMWWLYNRSGKTCACFARVSSLFLLFLSLCL